MYLESRRNLLRPKVIVDYDREAFVYKPGNVRITFDSHVKSALNSKALFDMKTPLVGVYEEPGVILEIKYDNFLPKHIRGLFPNTIRPGAANRVMSISTVTTGCG